MPARGWRLGGAIRWGAFAALLLLVLTCVSCTSDPDETEASLLVGVATSVQPAAAEFARRFEAEHGTVVTLVAGASGTLAAQVRQGAPLDLFVSADSRYSSALAQDGLLDPASLEVLATGELVAITNLEGAEDVLEPLLRTGQVRQVALANPDLAPYGHAAVSYLRDRGYWVELADRVAYGENVAQAFQFVASGNAEVGFVPRSLLIASDSRGIRALAPLPPEASSGLQVTVGMNVGSGNPNTVSEFIASMTDPQAADVWRRFGYTPHVAKVDGAE
ncbi:MAG: molybdate ABC transporter substrate-binding protein [Chloroflexi bacterium]|nr:molybdate ABC transporter substrate-binding protein [Chloroflexota bacterium]